MRHTDYTVPTASKPCERDALDENFLQSIKSAKGRGQGT